MSKTVIITGASGRLGQATARRLLASGWQLTLVSRDVKQLAGNENTYLVEADVSDAVGATSVIEACQKHFGATPQALAHCAGSTLITPLHLTSQVQYRSCLRANLDSAFFTLQAFIRGLLDEKRPGTAVMVSSVVADIGVTNHEAIAAAKGGIESLVRSAAATYSPSEIRINCISPGLMRSEATEPLFASKEAEARLSAQYPLGRYGSVEDGAAALCWLLSNDAGWVNGQVLSVDGGFTAIRPMVRVRA
jgi:NAD(P)-dependent dehydrogenase (short-subunit alcohol dehydrogenase family)